VSLLFVALSALCVVFRQLCAPSREHLDQRVKRRKVYEQRDREGVPKSDLHAVSKSERSQTNRQVLRDVQQNYVSHLDHSAVTVSELVTSWIRSTAPTRHCLHLPWSFCRSWQLPLSVKSKDVPTAQRDFLGRPW